MNRRDLFKFAGLGAAALLVPTTYFLPPRGGWIQRLKVRKVQQYVISNDSAPFRYDATWDLPNGEGRQYNVEMLYQNDQMARDILIRQMEFDGGIPNSNQFKLALPRGLMVAEFV